MRNFLVPNIDTSGIRETDIQARQAQALGMRNYLMQHEIGRLPEMEKREAEEHAIKMEDLQFKSMQSKMAILRDHGFTNFDKDTYDQLIDWMEELKLQPSKLMKPR